MIESGGSVILKHTDTHIQILLMVRLCQHIEKRDKPVWALEEYLTYQCWVIEHEGQSQCLWVLLELLMYLERHLQESCVLRFLNILHTAGRTKVM